MKHIHTITGSLTTATLLLALSLSAPASAEVLVPFKGTLEGSYTSSVDPGPPPVATIELSGTGHATHLGLFSFEFPHMVNFGNTPPEGIGTFTIAAANGDMLFVDVIGHSAPVEPGVLLVVEEAIITGGTGRFTGASGAFTVTRLLIQSEGITFGSFSGTISRPGARHAP
jgi:hypothetical protein